jgi:predicted GH43/DUF377 family glycosyl hydrolase
VDAKGVAHPHVLKIAGSYRMWYEAFDGNVHRLCMADSPDGVTWTRRGVALDVGGTASLDARGLRNPMVLQRKGKYELWYQGQSDQSPVYRVLRALSDDGAQWARQPGEIVLHPVDPLSGSQAILVDSAILLADGSVQVFFAKQVPDTADPGLLRYHIYTEVVNP